MSADIFLIIKINKIQSKQKVKVNKFKKIINHTLTDIFHHFSLKTYTQKYKKFWRVRFFFFFYSKKFKSFKLKRKTFKERRVSFISTLYVKSFSFNFKSNFFFGKIQIVSDWRRKLRFSILFPSFSFSKISFFLHRIVQ